MWVISKSKLREFWQTKAGKPAKKRLQAWYVIVEAAEWTNFADVKATFGASVDQVGDCVVFDIGGNHFRLIARLRFKSHKLFVLKIMTHGQYNNPAWKAECGCFQSPP